MNVTDMNSIAICMASSENLLTYILEGRLQFKNASEQMAAASFAFELCDHLRDNSCPVTTSKHLTVVYICILC